MSELSGLELRKKACEALGWTVQRIPIDPARAQWITDKGEPFPFTARFGPNDRFYAEDVLQLLHAIESDPAVSEPMFLEWCEKNGYSWTMHKSLFDPEFSLKIYSKTFPGNSIDADGATLSECRARAIVAASAREGGTRN